MSIKNVFFAILRSQICQEKLDENIKNLLDENAQIELYKLSASHDLAHIVANALFELKVDLSEKVAAAFKKQQMIAVFRYEKLKKDLLDVCGALEEANINYTPLKGSVIRNYYDKPWMRTSCDIDVLVSEEDLEKARKALVEKLGFEDKGIGNHDVSMNSPSGMHIELHYSLTGIHTLTPAKEILGDYKNYMKNAGGSKLEMEDSFFYFYHIDHMAKHFQHGGCGIKPFMDLWVLEHKVPSDPCRREELLKKGGLLTFANEARHLMRVWFENEEHSDVTKVMEEYLLNGGVYGTLENSVAMGQHKMGGKFKYALSRIFLTYDQLKFQYPALEKHKWLLPFMQVRRWFKLVFLGGMKRSAHELHANATTDKELSDKTRLLLEKLDISK